jgi:hypothetical protein
METTTVLCRCIKLWLAGRCACATSVVYNLSPSSCCRYNTKKQYKATQELLLSGTQALLKQKQVNEATELALLYVDSLALGQVADTDAAALGML